VYVAIGTGRINLTMKIVIEIPDITIKEAEKLIMLLRSFKIKKKRKE